MTPSETNLLKVVTRELRSFGGLERTLGQVRLKLMQVKDCKRFRNLTLTAFMCRLLDDPDMMHNFSMECFLPDQAKIPSSADLGMT
jgi:hypothetical protein